MVVGAAMAHNFGLASSTAGVTTNGMIAGGICIVVILIIGLLNRKKVA